jgi:hypothetical protein
MSDPLTASDFWPLILKLPHEERVRLAKLALRAAASDDASAAAYAAAPPTTEEFSSDQEALAWEAEGWEEFGASRWSPLPSLNEIIVVPATRTIRGIDTEVVLTPEDGMPAACALKPRSCVARQKRATWSRARHLERRPVAWGGASLADRLRFYCPRVAIDWVVQRWTELFFAS